MGPNAVHVIAENGKFTVRIVEDGKATDVDFLVEVHALAWAVGQSIRLNVDVTTLEHGSDHAAAASRVAVRHFFNRT